MKVIHVLRKPKSEGSVAQNVLKHGTGALNIDKSRVVHNEPIKEMGAQEGGNKVYAQSGRYEATTELKPSGRWPANLILQHLDGCRCDGTKQVKPSNGSGRAGPGSTGFQTSYVGGESKAKGFTGGTGKETVANWICVEGCPVKALDEQSGITPGDKRAFTGGKVEKGVDGKGEDIYAGGASRFFKQVKADEGD